MNDTIKKITIKKQRQWWEANRAKNMARLVFVPFLSLRSCHEAANKKTNMAQYLERMQHLKLVVDEWDPVLRHLIWKSKSNFSKNLFLNAFNSHKNQKHDLHVHFHHVDSLLKSKINTAQGVLAEMRGPLLELKFDLIEMSLQIYF